MFVNYPYLTQGDHLPSVGVLQKLLNRTGASLSVDGIFGPRTAAAVQDFQWPRGLGRSGNVDEGTWARLVADEDLPILDCVDVWDPSLYNMEAQDLGRTGANPILIGGMCNGLEQAVSEICSRGRNLFLLRFHGHGAPGVASVATGQGELDPDSVEGSDILNNRAAMATLGRLRGVLGPYGSVQFMHCQTGRGRSGRTLLSHIARALRAPVTAAVRDQLGGGLDTFRFEGPTYTACPSGSLSQWSRSLPDFVGMTVP